MFTHIYYLLLPLDGPKAKCHQPQTTKRLNNFPRPQTQKVEAQDKPPKYAK